MKHKEYAYAFPAIFIWSTVASAIKLTLQSLNYIHLLFYSSFVSLVALLAVLVVQHKIRLLKNLDGYLHSAILGFLNPFVYYILLFYAYSRLPAQEAQPLNYTWPIMLVLFSIPVLKHKIKAASIIALIISFTGVVIISTHGNIFSLKFERPDGIIAAIGSAIIWALFWIYNLKDPRDEVVKLFLNFLFGFIYISIVFIPEFSLIPSKTLLGAIYIGLFEMGITFILWLKALEYSATTAKVSNLIYITPFLSLLLIHLLVGERIIAPTIIGTLFIVGGITIQHYSM